MCVLSVVYLHVVLARVVEYARVGYSHEQVVENDHDVVVDSQTDEQKRCRRENFVAHRPEYNRRHYVACNNNPTFRLYLLCGRPIRPHCGSVCQSARLSVPPAVLQLPVPLVGPGPPIDSPAPSIRCKIEHLGAQINPI